MGLHSIVESCSHLYEFLWAPKLPEYLPQTLSRHSIKCLNEVGEYSIKRHVLDTSPGVDEEKISYPLYFFHYENHTGSQKKPEVLSGYLVCLARF